VAARAAELMHGCLPERARLETDVQRRKFLLASLGLAAAGAWLPAVLRAERPLKILVLGGTRFLGPHVAEYARARGHTLTFFNRGRTNTDVLPDIERILGDRNGQLDGLAGRKWDAVIDNSGYVPRHVRLSAELLHASVPHYLFVSSVSVYASFASANDEDSPVGKLADASVEKVDGETYGPLKALCESAASAVYGPAHTTVIRPGLIVGPDDNTDRFTYWPARAARGGELVAPGTPQDPVQVIDVRDLAAFVIRSVEQRIAGVFNTLSPPGRFSIGDVVDESIKAARQVVDPRPAPSAVWLPAEFLASQSVAPWSDMPVWAPSVGDEAGFAQTSATRALGAGMTIRPLAETVTDTLRWHLQRPEAERQKLKAGLAPEREAAVLAAWKERGPAGTG
jgi:2'-hydroxyisoflavone reductase